MLPYGIRMLPYGIGPVRQALLRCINRPLNFAAHPHHIRVLQIRDPRHQIFNVGNEALDLARSSRFDVTDAVAQSFLRRRPLARVCSVVPS